MDNEPLKIKIIGIGDGGARAISKMIAAGVGAGKFVEYLAIGNDENILLNSDAPKNIFLNRDMTTIYSELNDALDGAKLIFIVAGLASNAARVSVPLITTCARNLDAVTVAFVCRPSILENFPRKVNAEHTLNNLRANVNTIFAVSPEKFLVFRVNQPQISLEELFDVGDDIFCQGVQIFLDMLIDGDKNLALFKWGEAKFAYGEGKSAQKATQSAANFPTLDDDDLNHAAAVFLRLASGTPLPLKAIDAANSFIRKQLPPNAELFTQEDVVLSLEERVFAAIVLARQKT